MSYGGIGAEERKTMKASFFESIRYATPKKMPAQWPLPPGFYDPEVGVQTFQSTVERLQFVEEFGFG